MKLSRYNWGIWRNPDAFLLYIKVSGIRPKTVINLFGNHRIMIERKPPPIGREKL